jgi:hypothetical protein
MAFNRLIRFMKFRPSLSLLATTAVLELASVYAGQTNETAAPTRVLLGVFAHPDDETVCAGVLARAADSGWDVRVIFATSGDAGADVSGRNLIGTALGEKREREGANALAALGVKRPPTFLGFGDGTVAQSRLQVKERLVKELVGLKPDVILTFGPDGFTESLSGLIERVAFHNDDNLVPNTTLPSANSTFAYKPS